MLRRALIHFSDKAVLFPKCIATSQSRHKPTLDRSTKPLRSVYTQPAQKGALQAKHKAIYQSQHEAYQSKHTG